MNSERQNMDLPPRRLGLKSQTAAAHQALDDLIGNFDTQQDYADYLSGMARFRLPVEAWLLDKAMPDELGDWRPAVYGAQIVADLADLAIGPPVEFHPFNPPSGNGLIGLLYVLEGSALGARVLAKRAEAIGYSAEFGAQHLFHQARNFSSWRAFSDRMEKVWVYDEQAAVAWANTAFDYARNAFESTLDARSTVRRPLQLRP